jgi:riboflavin transporter FmnP
MWTQFINTTAGLYIMVIPYLFGYDKELSTHNYITGPLIATFAITAIWEVNRNACWLNIPVAAWLIISSILYGNDQAIYPNIIAAVVVIVFSAIKRKSKGIYGGGWRSLFQKNPAHIRKANSDN